jgi:hypothetical protein
VFLVTKLADFATAFMWSPIMTFYQYFKSDLTTISPSVYAIPKEYIFSIILIAVIGYVALLKFHSKEFEDGSLGLDKFKQTLTFKELRFYTTNLLFVLGNSLTSLILNNSVNIFLCNSSDTTVVDTSLQCRSLSHISLMLVSLFVLIIYYPLTVVIFPYASSIDRSKQIKYKAEFEVSYVQLKLVVGVLTTLFSVEVV